MATQRIIVRSFDGLLGQDVVFLGRQHRITAVEPYRHPTVDLPAVIVRDALGWGMTIFEGDPIEVAA